MAFQQGMAARADILRDVGENAPEHWDEGFRDRRCHIALTIYAADEGALARAVGTAMDELDASSGVTLLGTHAFGADEEAKNPFGFRDGIAQPTIKGSGVEPFPGDQEAIAPGEFILGEDSETGSPLGVPQPDQLGRNGSYVVLRKFVSRVGAFNDFLRDHADGEQEQQRLGAKMFGRWQSGAPLILAPNRDNPELGADPLRNNDFTFADDAKGLMCPHSAHMRRMNPRDSQMTILTDVKIKRIVRRSSTFGPKWSPELTAADDAAEDRGLYFIFISARAFDTIEFMQQEWINRGNFVDLADERDPIVGLHPEPGQFTVPEEPARERVNGVTTFNRMAGGEYMFMPSISALEWIGSTGWTT
jgi:Dyp-type peroxidase family